MLPTALLSEGEKDCLLLGYKESVACEAECSSYNNIVVSRFAHVENFMSNSEVLLQFKI